MNGSRRQLLAASLLAASLAVNGGLRVAVADEREARDDARNAAADASAHLRRITAVAGAAELALAETAEAQQDVAVSAELTARAADRVRRQADAGRSGIAAADAARAAASSRLEALRAAIAASTTQIEDLRTCTQAVEAAADAAAAGDTAGATAALQGAADACRRAQAATRVVDPTIRFPYDVADPFVLAADGGYYAYATNAAGGAVQVLRSADLTSWAYAGTALPAVASWAVPGATWAPSVLARPGGWVLYYAARDRSSNRQCISAATATSPAGPFTDASDAPLVCELDQGGSIDPSPYVAPGGQPHLVWKAEGEVVGRGATIRSAPLRSDGLALAGSPSVLLTVDQSWEGRTVEGPSLAQTAAGLVLLYSANRWDSAAYAVGAARCDSPSGPCRKVAGPILATFGPMVGPGGAELFTDAAGATRVVFHAWQGHEVGYPEHRYLHLGTLTADGGGVSIRID